MLQSCRSCGANYAIPDIRVEHAGEQGLRVRCAKCRAVMVVSRRPADTTGGLLGDVSGARYRASSEDDTQPELVERRRRSPARAGVGAMGLERAVEASGLPSPAVLSSSGVYRPAPGVGRAMTGLHLTASSDEARVWYVALRGASRGPFTPEEMLFLAREGRVRGSTLAWRPGFDAWLRLDAPEMTDALPDVRAEARARRQLERKSAARAHHDYGIQRLTLEPRTDAGSTGGGRPPALPREDDRAFDLSSIAALPPASATSVRQREAARARRMRSFVAGIVLAAVAWFAVAWFGAASPPVSERTAPAADVGASTASHLTTRPASTRGGIAAESH